MRKSVLMGFAAALALMGCARADAAVKLELVGKCFDRNDRAFWGYFEVVSAVKKRLGPQAEMTVRCLADKDASGKFRAASPDVLEDIFRVETVRRNYGARVADYITGLTVSNAYGENAWRVAAAYAGISPEELAAKAKQGGEQAADETYNYAKKKAIDKSIILVNGKPSASGGDLLTLLNEVNAVLPAAQRVKIPALSKQPVAAEPAPKMFVVVSKLDYAGNAAKELNDNLSASFGGKIEEIPYEAAKNNPELKDVKIEFLPYYLVENTPKTNAALGRYVEGGMVRKAGKYFAILETGANKVLLDKAASPKTLELWIMAHCPYGVMAVNTISENRKKGTFPADVKLHVRYIASTGKVENGKKSFSSMHGSAEWEEDVRQLLIQKNFPDKFWKYLDSRNRDYLSSIWETAAQEAGIDPEFIRKNFEAGKALLAEDVRASEAAGISASPTFLWEGNVTVAGMPGLKKVPGFEKIDLSEGHSGGAAAQGSCK